MSTTEQTLQIHPTVAMCVCMCACVWGFGGEEKEHIVIFQNATNKLLCD